MFRDYNMCCHSNTMIGRRYSGEAGCLNPIPFGRQFDEPIVVNFKQPGWGLQRKLREWACFPVDIGGIK